MTHPEQNNAPTGRPGENAGRGLVLSLCDRTGVMVRPWLAAGFAAVTVDLAIGAELGPGHSHVMTDLCRWRYPARFGPPAIVFAFPPCTDLAISGARWFSDKGLRALIDALELVEACRDICEGSGAPWFIENPIGTLATYWRPFDFSFDPCDYGDPYTKKTCLWVGGGFVMPPKIGPGDMFAPATRVEPTLGSLIVTMPDAIGRAERRSVTPTGFAQAVFDANVARVDRQVLTCSGCGSTESLEELRARNPGALSCCPERRMVSVNRKETER